MRLIEAVCINAVNICIIAVVFYTDDGMVAAREPKTPQDAVDILIFFFERVGLVANKNKTEVMVFFRGRSGRGSASRPTFPEWPPFTGSSGMGGD